MGETMAILLVTYDLRQPGRSYAPLFDYLEQYRHCKDLESVWLIETLRSPASIRDELSALVDRNDAIFVARIRKEWATRNYKCSAWLKGDDRMW